MDVNADDDDDTQSFIMGSDSTTMRLKRGVKFAAHAYVRSAALPFES